MPGHPREVVVGGIPGLDERPLLGDLADAVLLAVVLTKSNEKTMRRLRIGLEAFGQAFRRRLRSPSRMRISSTGDDPGGLEGLADRRDAIRDEGIAGRVDQEDCAPLGLQLGVPGVSDRRRDHLPGRVREGLRRSPGSSVPSSETLIVATPAIGRPSRTTGTFAAWASWTAWASSGSPGSPGSTIRAWGCRATASRTSWAWILVARRSGRLVRTVFVRRP